MRAIGGIGRFRQLREIHRLFFAGHDLDRAGGLLAVLVEECRVLIFRSRRASVVELDLGGPGRGQDGGRTTTVRRHDIVAGRAFGQERRRKAPTGQQENGRQDRERPASGGLVDRTPKSALVVQFGIDFGRSTIDPPIVPGPEIGDRRHGVVGCVRCCVLIRDPRIVLVGREVCRIVAFVRGFIGIEVGLRDGRVVGRGGVFEPGLVVGGIRLVSGLVVLIPLLDGPITLGRHVVVTFDGSSWIGRMAIVAGSGVRCRSEDVPEWVVLADETRQFCQRIRRGTVRPVARAE